MKCEKAIAIYLQLDNNQPLPLLLKLHMMTCKQCTKEIKILQKAYSSLQPPFNLPLKNSIMSQVMIQKPYRQTVSDFNWVVTGTVIFASIGLISYSDALHWMNYHFGNKILVPIYLVMGFVIAGYIGSYVATHLKKLQAIAQSIKSLL